MISILRLLLIYTASLLLVISCNTKTPDNTNKPNVILFVVDDLGYGDLGIYGQKIIKTPNIDALAKNGMQFQNHYAGSSVCAPSRCIFLTGNHAGHASIRFNNPWKERTRTLSTENAYCDRYLEGQYPMNPNDVTIAEVLKENGYSTALIGKWGLGAPISSSTPNKQGFDYFYGYNCQRQAHNLYPTYLWENESIVKLNNSFHHPDTKFSEDETILDPTIYQNYLQKEYAPQLMHYKALDFIRKCDSTPFFMYYASPLPHMPFQIMPELVQKYHDIIGDEQPYLGEISDDIPCRYPRATYAAMVSYIDTQLGELVALLKQENKLDNTIIIFTSDNGPANHEVSKFFNSAGNYSEEFDRTKNTLYEPGLKVPLIVNWKNNIQANSKSNLLSVSYDLFNTITDLCDIKKSLKNDGNSFYNQLLSKQNKTPDFIYWEIPSYKRLFAIRKNNWKLIVKNYHTDSSRVELFDIKNDSLELNNLALKNSIKTKELMLIAKSQFGK